MRVITICISALLLFLPVKVQANSEDACAIWICLPGGFPQGCGGAYSEFKHRIKKGRSPLPELSSCTTGPNGEKVSGHYQLGYERYEPCKDGYTLVEKRQSYHSNQAACYRSNCAPNEYRENDYRCENYQATLRPKPNFVKMWVDGDYLGQYFYQ